MTVESKSETFFRIAKKKGYNDIEKQDVIDVISAMQRHREDFTAASLGLDLGWGLEDHALVKIAHVEEILTEMGFLGKIGGILIRGVVYHMNDAKVKEILTVGVPTQSGYIWTEDAIMAVLDQAKEKTKDGRLMGQFPPITHDQIDEDRVSHIVQKLWVDRESSGRYLLKALISTLHTPYGELLETYWQQIRLGLRCNGSMIQGTTVIDHQGLEFITVDVVDMEREAICHLRGH